MSLPKGTDAEMDYDKLLDAVSRAGCRMLAAGAEIYRVEDTVRRMLAAYGVEGEVFAIPNCLIISLVDPEGGSHTRMCRPEAMPSTDIETIERYNAMSRAVCACPPDPEQLPAMVEDTARKIRRYSPALICAGYFVGALFFALLGSGGWAEGLAAAVAGLLAGLCVMALDRRRANFFFKTVAAAFVMGAAIYLQRALGLPINVDVAASGSLMVLVPGLVFTNFMCDLITGDPLSGTSTFIRAVLTATAIAVGTGLSLSLLRALGLPVEGTAQTAAYAPAVQCVLAFLGCAGFCLIYNIHDFGAVLCCLGGALGWAVRLAAGLVTDSLYLSYLAAAVAIAIYAEVMARIRKFPITGYLVVSFFPLVPGVYIYNTMRFGIQGKSELFLESGIRTIGLAACLAMGTLLVSTTVRTFSASRKERRAKHGAL